MNEGWETMPLKSFQGALTFSRDKTEHSSIDGKVQRQWGSQSGSWVVNFLSVN